MNSDKLKSNPLEEFSFSKAAIYRIEVFGELSPDWSERLQNMQIRVVRKEGLKAVSTLEGKISDQSALSGVLNSLYDLHMSVLSVMKLKNQIETEEI